MSLEHLTDDQLTEYHRLFVQLVEKSPHRAEKVKGQEYDYKFATHVVRLMNEVEQILTEHDLDLMRSSEQLKSIRRGEWPFEQVLDYFTRKEKDLEVAYQNSTLPYGPNEELIKEILLQCLEHHYGSLDKAVVVEGREANILRQIKQLVEGY